MLATARNLVQANDPGAHTADPVLSGNPLSVTVTGSVPKKHWFAPLIGHNATSVSATSTVAWGGPVDGVAKLPLIFSWCEWYAQTGGGLPSSTVERTILFPKTSDTGCTGSNGLFVPGGFGWLTTNGNSCRAASAIGNKQTSEPGNNPSKGCATTDFGALQGKTVLLPIFDTSGGTGSSAWYHVYGYAAFTITGYFFGGQYSWNKPCTGNDRCIRGYFTRFVDAGSDFDYGSGAPQLGAWVLRLIK
jgi:hypothetical protein